MLSANPGRISGRRSFTGHHKLLPAAEARAAHLYDDFLLAPPKTFIHWTFGRDTVIWRIWPAVALHTVWAAAVVLISFKTTIRLAIPPVLLTVLGMVIGFVISYRAMSGYDRYWMGRSLWGDLVRNGRGLGRLVWFHVPPALTARTNAETETGSLNRPAEEMEEVMLEKRMALDLITGFAVATKHHLRSERGIYYEDLYTLVEPLHEHEHEHGHEHHKHKHAHAQPDAQASASQNGTHQGSATPPGNAYGTFASPALHQNASVTALRASSPASSSDDGASLAHGRDGETRALLPAQKKRKNTFIGKISSDLVPFSSFFGPLARLVARRPVHEVPDPEQAVAAAQMTADGGEAGGGALTHAKHRPRVAGGGDNLPLEILMSLSEWFSVLEARNSVPGTSLGTMIAMLGMFDDTLAQLEKILTTPLPFVFSVHIRHTVWIYLFFLPFQLLDEFAGYTVLGVAIAAFIYLGFLAAGEEIEQPFGYDENDLDLDMFCLHLVRADMERLKRTPCANVYAGQVGDGDGMVNASANGKKAEPRVESVFARVDEEEE